MADTLPALPDTLAAEAEKTAILMAQVVKRHLDANSIRNGKMVIDKDGNVTKILVLNANTKMHEWNAGEGVVKAITQSHLLETEGREKHYAANLQESLRQQLAKGVTEEALLKQLQDAQANSKDDIDTLKRNAQIYMAQRIEAQKTAQAASKPLKAEERPLTGEELQKPAYDFGGLHKEAPGEVKTIRRQEAPKQPDPRKKFNPKNVAESAVDALPHAFADALAQADGEAPPAEAETPLPALSTKVTQAIEWAARDYVKSHQAQMLAIAVNSGQVVIDNKGEISKVIALDENKNPVGWDARPEKLAAVAETRTGESAQMEKRLVAAWTKMAHKSLANGESEADFVKAMHCAGFGFYEDSRTHLHNARILMAQQVEAMKQKQMEGKALTPAEQLLSAEELQKESYDFGTLHREKMKSMLSDEEKQEKFKKLFPPIDPFGSDITIVQADPVMEKAMSQFLAGANPPKPLAEGALEVPSVGTSGRKFALSV